MVKRLFPLCVLLLLWIPAEAGAQGFFQQHSTWYEPIPDNPPLVANSDDYVNDVIINSSVLTANSGDWSVPVWHADAGTPIQTVATSDSRSAEHGWNEVPIPAEAVPAPQADGHMVVVSHDSSYAWDFYQAEKAGDGSWSATFVRKWDLGTAGINSPYDGEGSARAAPVPLTHGLVTYDEIQQGRIDHALAFAYWGQAMPDPGVYPCEKYNGGINDREWAMHMGFRLQLDPSLNLDSLDLNPAARVIAQALQDYGMIFVENCGQGCNAVYLESMEGKTESWSGILDASITNIPLDRFRVVEPIYPSESPLSATVDPSVTEGDAPLDVSFNAQVSGGTSPYSYSWDFGDGGSSTDQAPTHTYDSEGSYTVALTVTDQDGSQASDNATITVTAPATSEDVLTARKTSSGIELDGQLSETAWSAADSVSFANADRSDNQVTVKALWDESAVYFAYRVTDAHHEYVGDNLWEDDGVEVFLDIGHEGSTSMDGNDYQFLANIADQKSSTDFSLRTETTAGEGWVMELSIPWSAMNATPSAGTVMGLLLVNNDRDSQSEIAAQFDWLDIIETGSFKRPNLWGDLALSAEEAGDTLAPAAPENVRVF